jgi:hypothetical protein
VAVVSLHEKRAKGTEDCLRWVQQGRTAHGIFQVFSLFGEAGGEEGREGGAEDGVHVFSLAPGREEGGKEGGREEAVRRMVEEAFLPRLQAYSPRFIFLSWGLELVGKPGKGGGWKGKEVGRVTQQVLRAMDACGGGKVVVVMEGAGEGGKEEEEAVLSVVGALLDPGREEEGRKAEGREGGKEGVGEGGGVQTTLVCRTSQ